MLQKNNQVFTAILTTRGRKTGKSHSVLLRAVMYKNKLYFSRHKPDGDWFLNALANPEVQVEFNEMKIRGNAFLVENDELAKKISQLKYPNEDRGNEKRVVVEVTLCELLW
jgi:deazaflavin-dependent oxidoreductase (nitroreductase family)